MTDVVICEGVSKSYGRSRPLGIKELLVGRHRTRRGGRFSRVWAVQDVSLRVVKGEALAVIGANGSGKSTLLSLLLGSIRPDRGSIRVAGRVASLLALGAGFHPELTGRQNVFLYGTILGMRLAEIRAVFDRIVEFSEIGDAIDNPLRTYSSGMTTRLGFSTIIHTPADLLLIDEVLAVGDRDFQAKCVSFLNDFRRRAGTLVIVSHDLVSLGRLCDHAIWLSEGQVVGRGPVEAVIHDYIQASASTPQLDGAAPG